MTITSLDLFTIKKLSGVLVDSINPPCFSMKSVAIAKELALAMDLGFKYDDNVIFHLLSLNDQQFETTVSSYHSVMNELKGGKLIFKALYRSFIDKPFSEMTTVDEFMQYVQYAFYNGDVGGHTTPRIITDIDVNKLQLIRGVTTDEVISKFREMITSKDSITSEDKTIIHNLITQYEEFFDVCMNVVPTHKETMAVVVNAMFCRLKQANEPANSDTFKTINSQYFKTITDVLRVAVVMSGQQPDMSEQVIFKKFSRKERKLLCNAIKVVHSKQSEFNFNEDMLRYKSLWKTLSKSIHVGDYGLHGAFTPLRDENIHVPTFYGLVENSEINTTVSLLVSRPTEFTRKLNDLLCKNPEHVDMILREYTRIAEDSSMNSLISALFHFNDINRQRFVVPKSGRSTIIPVEPSSLDESIAIKVAEILDIAINNKLASKDKMRGEFFIDDALYKVKLPTQMRSASTGTLSISRGTRLPIDTSKERIRLFTHWIGNDLDLSLLLLDADFNVKDRVSYYKPTYSLNDDVVIKHSGDYTYAPEPSGASEFVDINIKAMNGNSDVRYGVMYVNMYSGVKLNQLDHCVSGWLEHDNLKSSKLFIPTDVKNIIKLETNGLESVPLIIDFYTNEIIWCDVVAHIERESLGSNADSRSDMLQTVLRYAISNTRMSVGELMERNILMRGGAITEQPTDISSNYTLDDGLDVNSINSLWI